MMKPKVRPSKMKKKKSGAPTKSLRPRARPVDDGGAVARGNRAAMREATDAATLTMPEGQNMKAGGMAKKGFKAGGKMKKGFKAGGKMKKGFKAGGKMKKGFKAGGKMKKGFKAGGKLEMVKNKQGDTVPFYAADGKGKMKAGGKVKKGYAAGGKAKGAAKGGKAKGTAKGGKVRGAGIARKGVRPAKML